MAGVRFGCGEFVPGGQPVTVPNLPVPTPGTTLEPRDVNFKIPPIVPPVPPRRIIKVKCVTISPGLAPPPPPGMKWVNENYRMCKPCDGEVVNGEPNPDPDDTDCDYASIEDCKPNCRNPAIELLPPNPGYVSDKPTTGGSDVTRPTTGGGHVTWWFCNTSTGTCTSATLSSSKGIPNGSYKSEKLCKQFCISPIGGETGGRGNPFAPAPTGGPPGGPTTGGNTWWHCNNTTGNCTSISISSKRPQPAGSYDSKSKCETACVAQVGNNGSLYTNAPNESTGSRGQIYTNAPNQSVGSRGQIYTNAPNQSVGSRGQIYTNAPNQPGSYGNPKIPSVGNTNQQSVGEPNVKVINVLQEEALQNPSNPNASVQGSQL